MKVNYLKGLDPLRFLAALFVIISHGAISLNKLGVNSHLVTLEVFNKGGAAVEFFFTLSGFLITYLLIKEFESSGNISIKQFYKRRILRIWPLYFIVIILGFSFLGFIYPKFFGEQFFEFPISKGIFFYIFFLSNYAIIYRVGFMYPLWSISVEEQFYLFWAPLVKLFKKNIKLLILIFVVLTFSFSFFVVLKGDSYGRLVKFLDTLKFSNMAIGSLFGYILYYKFEKYDRSILSSKVVQFFVVAIILWFYIFGFKFRIAEYAILFMPFIYGMLILNVSVISRKLFSLDNKVLNYLGKISYGLYMYHMLVDYFLRFTIQKTGLQNLSFVFQVMYFVLLVSITVLISSLSYKYVESYFLSLKDVKIYAKGIFKKSTRD